MPPDWCDVRREARERFGVERFRPGQREVIEAVFAGRDVFAVLPTGGGKSLCFQLPARFLPHATVVVSPLIALMQDQQEKLEACDVPVAKLDSTLSAGAERAAVADVARGAADVVYVTPERLDRVAQLELLRRAGVSLVVVDEAHCVSQWGHDFRPAYLAIRDAIRLLGRPPVLALTATATPAVADDVVRQLALDDPVVVRTSIDRPNLAVAVHRTVNEAAKRARLRALLAADAGPVLVYVATTRAADAVWAWLAGEGVAVGRYHGKRPDKERAETQHRFMANAIRAVVATKAFGLGIDKPDIRAVVHWHVPDSLESWVQEAGRAGRDGAPAGCALLYRLEDRRIQTFFLGGRYPRRAETQHVLAALQRLADAAGARGVALRALVAACPEVPERRLRVVVAQLAGAGVVERGRRLRVLRRFASDDELEGFLGEYEARHRGDRERLDAMTAWAETVACRVQGLRRYFGEDAGAPCGRCDVCRGQAVRIGPARRRPTRRAPPRGRGDASVA